MAKKFPIFPKNPERICWGCDKYCREDDLRPFDARAFVDALLD